MITSPMGYLLILALVVTIFHLLESKMQFKLFKYIPAVVMIYAFSMLLASMNVFASNAEINAIYKLTKTNLLPAMLFLMLLQVDFRHFFKLGKSLLIAYVLAVLSIAFAFIFVAYFFGFNADMSAAFGALAGSWMGGTANMIAVGSALHVSEDAFAYALVVDSVNYTIWVMFLLFLVPFSSIFNKFTKSSENLAYLGDIGCACSMGAKRYWLLIALSLAVSLLSQMIATKFVLLNATTSIVLLASLFGILGSFTRLKNLNGSSEVSTTMLYIIIALIGSKAVINNFSGLGLYVLAGFTILVIHAIIMVLGAKIFKLDLFSVAVASLSNIGGVASAPILAATYNKSLVSVGVLMAIMGYLIGTFGGLLVGNILMGMSQ
ncbi:MAG: DUF819 family protein [Sulfurimonas sp.]